MTAGSNEETAALVALLRAGGRAWAAYIVAARRAGSAHAGLAQAVLEEELGLLAYGAAASAAAEVAAWQSRGYRLLSVIDSDYPDNLRVIDNRPPLLFLAGELTAADRRSVAVIGARQPSDTGRKIATAVAECLSLGGYSVFSGLAAGIDTCVHRAVLERGGRTVAVIGTGLEHSYPRENEQLQARIGREGAIVSQFWPDAAPTRQSFPARNALMSGLTLGSVIIEASPTSGTRVQARQALAQGRKLILMARVLAQDWAQELVGKPGVTVAQTPGDVLAALKR
jgi:DNA processing protein